MNWASRTTYSELPADVRSYGKAIVLDTVAAIVCGRAAAEVRELSADLLGPRSAGADSSQWRRLPESDSAFLLGLAASWLDIDETHFEARQHVAAHVLPASLVASRSFAASGADLLRAFIVAYEVSARLGRATDLRRDVMHSSGTHGTIGAAVAAALLSGRSEGEIVETVNVASAMTVASSIRTAAVGATSRNTYAAQAARNGVLAPRLVAAGVRGDPDGLMAVFGSVSGTRFRPDALCSDIATRYLLLANFVKRYAACAEAHPAILAAEQAMAGYHSRDLRSVEVRIEPSAAKVLGAPNVATDLAAHFSLPFLVAARLRGFGLEAIDAAVRSDPKVLSLMDSVIVVGDEGSHADESTLSASVSIKLSSGRTVAGSSNIDCLRRLGVMGETDIRDKFIAATSPIIGALEAQQMMEFVMSLEDQVDLSPLYRLVFDHEPFPS
ncbi:MmgE/PrpD family protein [Streptomyces sp. CLV115]|uniref:MmgE/PrpD family protein n=1 Tax=Streptomyces sp. CLV115 TaxID=3138502 RepID=UPI00313DB829